MTVHINGSKGKELYYNGVKIKEAYYNGNKVYSSRHTETVYLNNATGGMIPSGILRAGVTYEIKITSATSSSGDGRTVLFICDNRGYFYVAHYFLNKVTLTNYVGSVFYYTPSEDLIYDPSNQKLSQFYLTSSNTNFAGSVTLEVSWG